MIKYVPVSDATVTLLVNHFAPVYAPIFDLCDKTPPPRLTRKDFNKHFRRVQQSLQFFLKRYKVELPVRAEVRHILEIIEQGYHVTTTRDAYTAEVHGWGIVLCDLAVEESRDANTQQEYWFYYNPPNKKEEVF